MRSSVKDASTADVRKPKSLVRRQLTTNVKADGRCDFRLPVVTRVKGGLDAADVAIPELFRVHTVVVADEYVVSYCVLDPRELELATM